MSAAIDLFCGLGGWTEGLLAEGYDVTGYDIEAHEYTALFDACFRIQREASAAAGRHIPMVVENVRGAEPWVGRAKWSFGSYYLWGDVPALMPKPIDARKFNPDGTQHGQGSWFAVADSKERGAREGVKVGGMKWFHPSDPRHVRGQGFNTLADRQNREGQKMPSVSGRSPAPGNGARFTSVEPREGRKGAGAGAEWFDQNLAVLPSKSPARKAASAKIAKIPFALSQHIARTYKPLHLLPLGARAK